MYPFAPCDRIKSCSFWPSRTVCVSANPPPPPPAHPLFTHPVRSCDHETVEAWTLAVSKDDKLLASGTQKGSVNLWALDGHKKVCNCMSYPTKCTPGTSDQSVSSWRRTKARAVARGVWCGVWCGLFCIVCGCRHRRRAAEARRPCFGLQSPWCSLGVFRWTNLRIYSSAAHT